MFGRRINLGSLVIAALAAMGARRAAAPPERSSFPP